MQAVFFMHSDESPPGDFVGECLQWGEIISCKFLRQVYSPYGIFSQ
jgi:hypothetical protein